MPGNAGSRAMVGSPGGGGGGVEFDTPPEDPPPHACKSIANMSVAAIPGSSFESGMMQSLAARRFLSIALYPDRVTMSAECDKAAIDLYAQEGLEPLK